jgi:hypothetical protein
LDIDLTVIEELVAGYLDNGLDLNGVRNLEDLVRKVVWRYIDSDSDYEDEEDEDVDGGEEDQKARNNPWPKILWIQELQTILEDKTRGLEQALVKGWRWFIDREGYSVKTMGLQEYAPGWQELEAVKRARFLEVFKIVARALKRWTSTVEGMTLQGPDVMAHEMSVCKSEFRAQGRVLISS